MLANHQRFRSARRAFAPLCIAALPTWSLAQPALQAPPDDRLNRLERRLDELDRQRQAELKTRDEEIARLRSRLDAAPAAPAATAPAADDVERTKRDILKDIDANQSGTFLHPNPISFNPDVAVIGDFLGSSSTRRQNDAYNRFDVREVELDLRAAVDPRADAVVILAFERDVENPVFPGDEPAEGPESSVSIEEAFLSLHDFGVPNLTAKLGRFHVRFGRQNMLHLHDLPTANVPFVNQAFLAPESLTDAGLSLSYVLPPNLVGGQYIELIGEVIAGEGGSSAESPTLGGDLTVDSPAFNLHALWNADVAPNWNLELGGSYLWGRREAQHGVDVHLFGGDVTLIRTDPTGKFFNQLFQAEAIYGMVDQSEGGDTQDALGAYVLAQQQLNRDWYAGLRLDWTEDPNNDGTEAWGVSPYVSWYWSEFLRFRLEYQHKAGDVPTENNLFFQATWIFGAHPPHPYWSMR